MKATDIVSRVQEGTLTSGCVSLAAALGDKECQKVDEPHMLELTALQRVERLRVHSDEVFLRAAVAASMALTDIRINRELKDSIIGGMPSEPTSEIREFLTRMRDQLAEQDPMHCAQTAIANYLVEPTTKHLQDAGDKAFNSRTLGWGFIDHRGEPKEPMQRILRWAELVLTTGSDKAVSSEETIAEVWTRIQTNLVPWLLNET
jgi:hypothetical protein